MQKLLQSTFLSLLLIFLGVGLMLVVFIDLMRPQFLSLAPHPEDSTILESNWFSERTFDLLTNGRAQIEGIDTQQIEAYNPFKQATQTVQVKEPPVVEPESAPTPPATRIISVVYRGLYRSSDGDPFIYLEVEGNTRVLSINGTVADFWTITEANTSELVLKKDEVDRVRLPFNREKSLEVPVK